MAENSSKSDQIRKLREIRMLAREKVTADCEADAKRASKSFALKKNPKPSHEERYDTLCPNVLWLPADRA